MGDGWLWNPKDGWTYRFQRYEKSWLQDSFVLVDKGRAMPDGSPALLKTRQYLRRGAAEGMWRDLVRKGWEKIPAVWGAEAEHRSKKYQSVFCEKESDHSAKV